MRVSVEICTHYLSEGQRGRGDRGMGDMEGMGDRLPTSVHVSCGEDTTLYPPAPSPVAPPGSPGPSSHSVIFSAPGASGHNLLQTINNYNILFTGMFLAR